MISENDYNIARDKIDLLIKNSSSEALEHLKIISSVRTEKTMKLIDEWHSIYEKKLRNFTLDLDSNEIEYRIGKAYTRYVKFSFMYRYVNILEDNIKFHKIFSFVWSFFSDVDILSEKEKLFELPEKFTDDEQLFSISPLTHFMFFWLLSEFHVTGYSMIKAEEFSALINKLIESIRSHILNFSIEKNGHRLQIDDFRLYLKKSKSGDLGLAFNLIESRPHSI